MVFALIGVSVPTFWLGFLLLYIFWFKLQWAPALGIPIGESVLEAVLQGRLILPWLVLALTSAALYARMVRGDLIETMNEDYIRTARAKGLSEKRVIYNTDCVRRSPRSSRCSASTWASCWVAPSSPRRVQSPGVGQYAVQSITRNDFPSVMGVTIFATLFIVVANLIVDVAYAFLDPRVRYT